MVMFGSCCNMCGNMPSDFDNSIEFPLLERSVEIKNGFCQEAISNLTQYKGKTQYSKYGNFCGDIKKENSCIRKILTAINNLNQNETALLNIEEKTHDAKIQTAAQYFIKDTKLFKFIRVNNKPAENTTEIIEDYNPQYIQGQAYLKINGEIEKLELITDKLGDFKWQQQ